MPKLEESLSRFFGDCGFEFNGGILIIIVLVFLLLSPLLEAYIYVGANITKHKNNAKNIIIFLHLFILSPL